LWEFNGDGTATAQPGDTLSDLAKLITGSGASWTQLGYSGVPEQLQEGQKVNYLGLVTSISIYNQDPSPGQNLIVNTDLTDGIPDWWAGHSWTSVIPPDPNESLAKTGKAATLGFGPPENDPNAYDPAKDPLKNRSLPGVIYTAAQGDPSTSYTIPVTQAQVAAFVAAWNELAAANTGYSYLGSNLPGNTFCTETVLNTLNAAGVLNPVEKAMLLTTPYAAWGNAYPIGSEIAAAGHQQTAAALANQTLPNPNEFESRLRDLNTIKQIVTETMGASTWNKGR
jgi:hypothetical protein